MPLYEYLCQACGETFERLQPISREADPPTRCVCGSEQVERILYSRIAMGRSSTTSAAACSPVGT